MDSSSAPATGEGPGNAPGYPANARSHVGAGAAVRIFATLSLLILVGTYVAAQVDFLRRHRPGIQPLKYWLPQARMIWVPGLALALLCAAAAFALHRWRRRK
jgi:hypothetical protein